MDIGEREKPALARAKAPEDLEEECPGEGRGAWRLERVEEVAVGGVKRSERAALQTLPVLLPKETVEAAEEVARG
ncbi:MAG: hypothetical protein KDD47_10055 [Acidobacteria bacterium]|nr:hypothetical protein [Acidobacteriota bacterium]